MLKKINRFMFALPTISFVFLILLGSFLFVIPLDLFLPEIQKNPITEATLILQVLLGVLAAPIYETVVFQVFLFWLLSWIPYIKNRDYLIILIASIIFGLNHQYGITYIVGTTIIGLLYNYAYWVYKKRMKNIRLPCLLFGLFF